jgi:hypothetical protein
LPPSSAKVRLRNIGNGTLELTGDTLRFYTKKGRVKKRKENLKEILIADIENIERDENEFSINWKGTDYAFVSENGEFVEAICAKVTEALKERKKALDDTENVNRTRSELVELLRIALEIVNSLFDILRSLQGQIDWNRIKVCFKRSEENIRNFTCQRIETPNLDFAKLSLAIKDHDPKETSEETYSVLKSLYEHFSGLTSKNGSLEQIHPNYHDAKTIVLTYYTLNDIILGTTVGDEEIRKEINEFVMMLDDISKEADSKINVDAIKESINRLCVEKENEKIIEESRAVFIKQLAEY